MQLKIYFISMLYSVKLAMFDSLFLSVSFRAGVPNRAIHRHACRYCNYMSSHAVGETSSDLVGSARVRRHPHHRARSDPRSGVSCGPRAYRVRVPISSDCFCYCASGGGVEAISVIAWNSARNSGRCCIRYRTIRAFWSNFPKYPFTTVSRR
jgi:hypothetical protein